MREGFGLMFYEPNIGHLEKTLSEWCRRHVAKLKRRPNTLYVNLEASRELPSFVYVIVGRSRYRINIKASKSILKHHWLLIKEKGGEYNEKRATKQIGPD